MHTDWWKTAVVYQVYLRSFADSDGDGNGDIAGLTDRLPYIRDLGVDAIWLTPWYPSPMVDNGYDVSDYRDIDPMFGNLTQAQELIDAVHDHGMRVILDLVANHTSDQHPWFQAALAAPDGSLDRDRYHFRDGQGPNGDAHRTTGSARSGASPGPGPHVRTERPASGTSTCSPPNSPT